MRGYFQVAASTTARSTKAAGRSQEILAAHFRPEQAGQAGGARLAARSLAAATDHAPRFIARDPAEAVITKYEVEKVVVL